MQLIMQPWHPGTTPCPFVQNSESVSGQAKRGPGPNARHCCGHMRLIRLMITIHLWNLFVGMSAIRQSTSIKNLSEALKVEKKGKGIDSLSFDHTHGPSLKLGHRLLHFLPTLYRFSLLSKGAENQTYGSLDRGLLRRSRGRRPPLLANEDRDRQM